MTLTERLATLQPNDRTPDPCPLGCGHSFHGLPCARNTGSMEQPICGCPGPWPEGAA